MSISREILQRALLLSRSRKKIFLAFLVSALISISSFALDAPVFLKEGPDESSGLPFIYPNAIKVFTGIYGYHNTLVRVLFTSEDFLIPEEWKQKSCGDYRGYQFSDTSYLLTPGGEVFCYRYKPSGNDIAWSVFIIFEKDTDCTFVPAYLKRFIYLQRNWDPVSPPLMPAVIE